MNRTLSAFAVTTVLALAVAIPQASASPTVKNPCANGSKEDPSTGRDCNRPGDAPQGKPVFTYHGKEASPEEVRYAAVCTETNPGHMKCYDSVDEEIRDLASTSPGHSLMAIRKGLDFPGRMKAGEIASGLVKMGMKAEDAQHEVDQAIARSQGSKSLQTPVVNAVEDCMQPYVCLWDWNNYYGYIIRFSSSGSKNLADYGYANRASSTCNNRIQYGASLYDWRTGLPDPRFIIALGSCYDLWYQQTGYGYRWDNVADELVL